jgi:hypothetical protein
MGLHRLRFHSVTPLVIAAIVAVVPAAAGCAKGTETAKSSASSPSPSPSVDPAVELAASLKDLTTTSFKVIAKSTGGDSPSTATAVVDPTAKNALITIEGDIQGAAVKLEMLLVGTDRYTRFAGMPLPELNSTVWMHLDTTKANANRNLSFEKFIDPVGGAEFSRAIVTAQRSGTGRYTGAFDLTKAVDMVSLTESEVAALGAPAKSLPFEATTDEKGRLTKLTFTVPAHESVTAAVQETTFSEYGNPVSLPKPTGAEVKEAPASTYEMLGS